MAKLTILGPRMTADQARDIFRADCSQAIYWSAQPDKKGGMVFLKDLSDDTSILDHPAVENTVRSYEKAALLEQIRAGKMDGQILPAAPRFGAAQEWDLFELHLSPQETKRLLEKSDLDGIMFQKLVVDGIRTDEECAGYRQAASFGSVDERGVIRLHIIVNAFSVASPEDYDDLSRPLVSPAVQPRRDSVLHNMVQHINQQLAEAGLGVTISEACVQREPPERDFSAPEAEARNGLRM